MLGARARAMWPVAAVASPRVESVNASEALNTNLGMIINSSQLCLCEQPDHATSTGPVRRS